MRRFLTFVLGGIGGAALDQIHVRSGVITYRDTDGQPRWVGPQFGVATLAMLAGATRFAPDDGSHRAVATQLATGAAWFVGSYAASGKAHSRAPRAFAAALAGCAALRIGQRRDRARVLLFALLLAALGTGYEHVLAGTGAFSYDEPDLGNVPSWLPGLYLQGAPLAIDLARALR